MTKVKVSFGCGCGCGSDMSASKKEEVSEPMCAMNKEKPAVKEAETKQVKKDDSAKK